MGIHASALGPNLRLRRQAQQRSVASVARECRISRSHLYDLEVGRTEPSLTVLVKLSKALKCTPNDLLTAPQQEEESVGL